ncbi:MULTISPECIES: DEAD/DEAH box helicase [unclassified Spirosoma]|uniref:DEAD/DEAH box helicase n=1 Tax=unclassified Spirosoma TaxID=2621999 RepID=UPI00095F4186|nr:MULTISPECIES: DEAD/DEAH box helicase [unclassified Spirosoma]MBN8822332.1 DEAD/DEAH box helicase [Spirosoma sp.]OJW72368.1 MAG: RNA helicase [Spirosoma sp. 48-14]
MKTKTTKSADQADLLDIEKIATELAAQAEPKKAKTTKKKATPEDELAPDTAVETVAEGVADKVIIVADESTTPATEAPQATVETTPKADPNQILFSSLDISDEILQAVTDMGFVSPSPIQAEAIPPILAGRDVIGQAQTGTGKTAAFGIPALELIDVQDRSVQTLILCPTRELALQVADEIRKLAKYKRGVRIEAIYGGDSIERQIRSLKSGVHIVIGTPGRVMDHMERNTLKLDNVKMMILDEADEMLDMGFREDIESILDDMPEERQTILFSATMSKPIMQITQKFLQDPVLVKVVKKELTNTNIEQVYFEVKPKAKVEVMCRLIDTYDLKLLLVFCNTKRKVDEIVEDLQIRGYQAEGLHGDLRQAQRNNVMSKFRAGTTSILVATDVAARGIDVDDVDAVINFDIPLDEEYYVHRIGRTGRAGKSGRAFSLVGRDEKFRFREIQNYTKVRVEKGVIPSFEDIVGIRKARFIEQLQQTIAESNDLNLYDDLLTQLHHAGFSTEQIVGALVKRSMGIEKNEFADQNLGLDDDRRREDRRDRFGDRRGEGRDDRRGGRFGDRDDRGGRFDRNDRGNSRFGDRDRRGDGPDRGGFGDRPRFGDRNDRERSFGPRDGGRGDGPGRNGYFDKDDKRQPREREANMTRLMVTIGRRDYVRPGDIVGAIAGEANIPGNSIGSIDIFDKFTYVDVPKDVANRVVDAMEGNTIKGRRVNIEVAR